MTHLYEIIRWRSEFERLAESGELDPQLIVDTLESLDGQLNDKAITIAQFTRNLDATAQAVREAGKAMLERAARLEKRAESIRAYMLYQLQFAGITKIECPWFVIQVKKNPTSVVIDDEAAIPPEFMAQPEPPPPRPDKGKIRDGAEGRRGRAGRASDAGRKSGDQGMSTVGRRPKLSPDQARRLREWAAIGTTTTQAARTFGVSPNALRRYLRGEHKRGAA